MTNFLLGKGENLIEEISVQGGGSPKSPPYTISEAKLRVSSMLEQSCNTLRKLPDSAFPRDEAVISLVLHPEYVAKSYFPNALLRHASLVYVGCVPSEVKPDKRSKGRTPIDSETTELYVKGEREDLYSWSDAIADWDESRNYTKELIALEKLYLRSPAEKIYSSFGQEIHAIVEVVLHANETESRNYVIAGFKNYLKENKVKFEITHKFFVQHLTFIVLKTSEESVQAIASFSLVRVLRRLAGLRSIRPLPVLRAAQDTDHMVTLPKHGCISEAVSVAILDAGLPSEHPMIPWVDYADEVGGGTIPDPDDLQHGLAVTSATLFGHVNPYEELPQPYTNVKHFRVHDSTENDEGLTLPRVLSRIQDVLTRNEFDFVNLSLGPDEPIVDDDIHVWTAVIDDCLSRNGSLMTVAVGNNGESDGALGLNRIQVPSDCVNALGIGACNSNTFLWSPAPYSAVGPGRRPGWVKPELVAFGGSIAEPFLYLGAGSDSSLHQTQGTSFAAPVVLRIASALRAHFPDLSNLATAALLINTATPHSDATRTEVGWGRVCEDLNEMVVCRDGEIRVLYEGEVSPTRWIRAPIPVPPEVESGMVTIVATLYFKSEVDVNSPSNYTGSGIEIVFRPHDQKFPPEGNSQHPSSASFFGNPGGSQTELNLRRDAFKWENCMHSSKNKRASSLSNPCFDIHHLTRSEGQPIASQENLRFALVVSIAASRTRNLYDIVVQRYRGILEPLTPIVELPIELNA